MLNYEEICGLIKQVPTTYLPGLLSVVATESIKKCFKPGGASRCVASIEQHISAEKSGSKQTKPKIKTLYCGRCMSNFLLDDNSIHRRCGLNGCPGRLHDIGS